MNMTHWTILVAATACLASAGCKKKSAAGGPGGMPPVQVIVVEARRQTVWETLSSPGTITANEQVEIKAETDGIVQEINFDEGELDATLVKVFNELVELSLCKRFCQQGATQRGRKIPKLTTYRQCFRPSNCRFLDQLRLWRFRCAQ